MVIYSYTGGAHGRKDYYSWNWSKKDKRFLSLDDVIKTKQFTYIRERSRQILLEKHNQDKDSIYSGTSKKEDFRIWNFDRTGIVFVFPEYQVAPYSAGSFEVYIPIKLY